jgi:bacteriocin-like protein
MTDKARKPTDVGPNPLANLSALSENELSAVSGGLGGRKSAGGTATGVMFLTYTFKLV